jgi:hypothetical protein
MRLFWRGEDQDIEAELRTFRPEPRPGFLAALSEDLHERVHHTRTVRRAALAGALTVGMLSIFGALGGIGYAASAAHSAFHLSKIEQLVGISQAPSPTVQAQSTENGDNPVFGDQYRPGKGCGDKNHVHLRKNECKKPH